MALYVRISTRFVRKERIEPILDLANVQVAKPGTRVFTRLIARLCIDYPGLSLYVESVLEPRFGEYLGRIGFEKLDPHTHGSSFLLRAYNVDNGKSARNA